MSTITDTLLTVFAVKGVSGMISAFKAAQSAQESLDMADLKAQKARKLKASSLTRAGAESALLIAQTNSLSVAAGQFTAAASGVAALVAGLYKAVDAYRAMGVEIMNIRDLTGSSAQEAARAVTLMRVAGINDAGAAQAMLALPKTVFSGQGRSALALLGISADPRENGLDLFEKITDGIHRSTLPALRKLQIEETLFGAGGATALQPLLRMSKETRQEISGLATTFSEEGLQAIQKFTEQSAILGLTFLNKVVYPIGQTAMPVFLGFVGVLKTIATWFGELNEWTHGWGGALLIAAGALGSILALFVAGRGVVAAFNVVLKTSAALQAFITALQGAGGIAKVAAAVAVTGVVLGVGALAYNQFEHGQGNHATDEFSRAVAKFGASVDAMQENWQAINKGGVPKGIDNIQTIWEIDRRAALQAIG